MKNETELGKDITRYVEATSFGGMTLLGFNEREPYPRPSGNCFSLVDEQGFTFRVLNFGAENFKELLRLGVISYPVKIGIYGKSHMALVDDPRIPDEWYNDRLCTVCCPEHMLPPSQPSYREKISPGGIILGCSR